MKNSRTPFALPRFATLLAAGALGLLPLAAVRAADTPQETVNEDAAILRSFERLPEAGIPRDILRNARGVAVLRVIKGGFIFSGRGGQGVVLSRLRGGGWSGPAFIGTGGAGFGFQVGGSVTDFVFILNTRAAVEAFSRGGNVSIGGALSAAAGPVGRAAEGAVLPVAAIYTYSRSKGLFAGASLEGTVIVEQGDRNARYYGRPVSPAAILSGWVPAPARAGKLRASLGGY